MHSQTKGQKVAKKSKIPTWGELEILFILCRGATTVKEVNEEINKKRKATYSTTLKMMQIMRRKGLVRCRKSPVPQPDTYEPVESREKIGGRVLERYAKLMWRGSINQLATDFLKARQDATPEQQEVLRGMVEEAHRIRDAEE